MRELPGGGGRPVVLLESLLRLKEINEPNINQQEARHLHPWGTSRYIRNTGCHRSEPSHTVAHSYRYPEGVCALAIRHNDISPPGFLLQHRIWMAQVSRVLRLVTLNRQLMKVHRSLPHIVSSVLRRITCKQDAK
ncbi:hypothetical protein QLX08_002048 [Tetragonisca angustula]|uniref:Uncharacterized protein n=1 Tax=Tetragonisca angustula TaxID=166442 RepID=A0AAW1ACS4_9HYME